MSEKIGEGLQYTVYRVSEGRVKKVPRSKDEMLEYCLECGDSKEKAESSTRKALNRRKKAVKELGSGDFDLSIFGNPVFKENGEVVQQKVVPVDEYFETADLEEKQRAIDQYVELIQKLWEQGVGDTIYNFTVNTGLKSDGELVMIDFGEIIFSKERIRSEIKDKKWLDKWSYKEGLKDERVRRYFKERMAEEITVEKLEDKWREDI